ncbi:MAG: X2-like carbohydrate binding domain-containing protein, partial [Bacillota bacterium]
MLAALDSGGEPVLTFPTAADGLTGKLPSVLLALLELDDADYLVYTDEINAVYVKIPVGATISPTSAVFDKNPAEQEDVTATITWNDAASVADVKAGGTSIGTGNYSVNGNTLTVKKEYLATKADGDLVLTVEFDDGGSVMLTITVSESTTNTGSGSGGNGPAYSSRTLTDSATGITVSGD